MPQERSLNILCLASYEKGHSFLRECKQQGCYVALLTVDKLHDAAWPHDSIDAFLTIPDLSNREQAVHAASNIARDLAVDRVVALDDYDVETAAGIREHLRCPGMGETTARYFRDKLAMRSQAQDHSIFVPPFVSTINSARLHEYIERVPPPWVLKPRSEAASVGIRRIYGEQELWPALDSLGDRQPYFLLEKYIPGDVYHIDAITYEREVLFAEVHRYGVPPLNVVHDGGLFTSRTLPRSSEEATQLRDLNGKLLAAMGFVRGVSHTEFIRAQEDGRYYFLETAARVGGAYLTELVAASTGIDLWAEWARVEIAGGEGPYSVPQHRQDYAGIIISLARQDYPDTGAYNDPEVVWRLNHHHHAGLIVASSDPDRVQSLLEAYGPRFYNDFFASQPAPDKPTS